VFGKGRKEARKVEQNLAVFSSEIRLSRIGGYPISKERTFDRRQPGALVVSSARLNRFCSQMSILEGKQGG